MCVFTEAGYPNKKKYNCLRCKEELQIFVEIILTENQARLNNDSLS